MPAAKSRLSRTGAVDLSAIYLEARRLPSRNATAFPAAIYHLED